MIFVLTLALAPTFFVMLLGYTAGRAGIVNDMHVAELNTVVMGYALPASLLVATASTPRSALIAQWPVLVSLAAVMMGTYVLWYGYQRSMRKQDPSESALQALAVGQPNFAAAGLPVITALFGADQAATVAVGIAVGSLLPSPLTLAILELSEAKAGTSFFARSHGAHCACLGSCSVEANCIGTCYWDFDIAHRVAPASRCISSPTGNRTTAGGLALFVTGLVLSERPFRLSRNTMFGAGIANIAQPLITFAICRELDASVLTTKLSVVMAAPSGFLESTFASRRGSRGSYVAGG
jgi:malonate transporter and related proteins